MNNQNSYRYPAASQWTNPGATAQGEQAGDQPAYFDLPVPQPHQMSGSPNQAYGAPTYPSNQVAPPTYPPAPGGFHVQQASVDNTHQYAQPAFGQPHGQVVAHQSQRARTLPAATQHSIDYAHTPGYSASGLASAPATHAGFPGHGGQYAAPANHMPAQGHGGQRMAAQRTDSGYAYSDQFPVQVHQQAAHSTAGARIASSSSVHGVVQGTGGGGSSNSHPSRAEVPKCRVPDCPLEIFYDTHGKEWSDYCGDAHVLEAVARGLSPRCYHCLARPCRSGDYYCGKICREAAAAKRL